MKEFKNKVAVVTGAASGIGRALAERSAREGMKVVLSDIEGPALARAAQELESAGAMVLAVHADVSHLQDVENLARCALDAFGAVHLLFNNAGVAALASTIWETTEADWQWMMGVNLWGVIHGLRVFVPIMLAQGTDCHIVNTASVAAFQGDHSSASYLVTKHAVLALSEHLYHSLLEQRARIGASVLCPGWVRTRIVDSERNRPPALRNEAAVAPMPPHVEALLREVGRAIDAGMAPEQVAGLTFRAIREERFYIFSDLVDRPTIEKRMQAILCALDDLQQ